MRLAVHPVALAPAAAAPRRWAAQPVPAETLAAVTQPVARSEQEATARTSAARAAVAKAKRRSAMGTTFRSVAAMILPARPHAKTVRGPARALRRRVAAARCARTNSTA